MHKFLIAILFAGLSTGALAETLPDNPAVKSADGMRIAYEVHGTGEIAVVLVHGWSCDRTYFEGQTGPLATKYKVVSLDLAGHGASSLGRKNSTIASFGQDVAAVVKKLKLKRVVLVGHSMGGDVVVAAARLLKGRVVGLVWLEDYKEIGPVRSDADIEKFAAKLRADFPGVTRNVVRNLFRLDADPTLVERIANDMASAPPEVAIPSIESSFRYAREIPAALAALKLPVIAINGDNGSTDVASLEKHGVKTVIMSGAGHFLMLEDPAHFNPLLISAIEELAK
jgi:pimeloyl-ACP methyl ester carboxylesterase